MRTLTLGLAVGGMLMAAVALAKQPPPMIRELGPVQPTPAPSPQAEQRIRLISSLTVQNRPDGPSVISFEATDFGKGRAAKPKGSEPASSGKASKPDKDKYRVLATDLYTTVEPKNKRAQELADAIVRQIRALELDLLEYVEVTGPPRERQPLSEQGPSARPQ